VATIAALERANLLPTFLQRIKTWDIPIIHLGDAVRAVVVLTFAVVAGMAGAAWPQSGSDTSFLRPETQNSAACDTQFPSKIPVRCWVGQQFLVLPQDTRLRHFGYAEFNKADGTGTPSYDALAGKIVTVTGVQWEAARKFPSPSRWFVTLKADDTSAVYTVRPVTLPTESPDDAAVDSLALFRDLKIARDKYLGGHFWIMRTWLPQLGENGAIVPPGKVSYKQCAPVMVSDVLASYTAEHPVRIVVKNDAGQEGYFDIAMSPTNIRDTSHLVLGDAAVAQYLASNDPELGHKWPAKIWAAIEDGNVLLGMTAEQARLSWHDPKDISRAAITDGFREHWTYPGHRYLDLKNGVVTEVQN
jgi:hypothetical protein